MTFFLLKDKNKLWVQRNEYTSNYISQGQKTFIAEQFGMSLILGRIYVCECCYTYLPHLEQTQKDTIIINELIGCVHTQRHSFLFWLSTFIEETESFVVDYATFNVVLFCFIEIIEGTKLKVRNKRRRKKVTISNFFFGSLCMKTSFLDEYCKQRFKRTSMSLSKKKRQKLTIFWPLGIVQLTTTKPLSHQRQMILQHFSNKWVSWLYCFATYIFFSNTDFIFMFFQFSLWWRNVLF